MQLQVWSLLWMTQNPVCIFLTRMHWYRVKERGWCGEYLNETLQCVRECSVERCSGALVYHWTNFMWNWPSLLDISKWDKDCDKNDLKYCVMRFILCLVNSVECLSTVWLTETLPSAVWNPSSIEVEIQATVFFTVLLNNNSVPERKMLWVWLRWLLKNNSHFADSWLETSYPRKPYGFDDCPSRQNITCASWYS